MVLVLKALAHRIGEDDDDLRLLAGKAGLTSTDAVVDLVERVAGSRLATAQVQFFVEAALDTWAWRAGTVWNAGVRTRTRRARPARGRRRCSSRRTPQADSEVPR